MSKGKRDLTGEEKKLWRRVAASVKTRRPLPADEIDHPEPARTARAIAQPHAPVAPKLARAVKSAPPPQNRGNEKRVRRGKLEIGATLDLHGHTQESAERALIRFLHRAQSRGESTVIVVTGVGRGGEGVLKRRLPDWLAGRELRGVISGFAPAHRTHGGGGAFYVFVKRARETET